MVRVSEVDADRRAAKTYLATLGSPELDLLPYEVVGCAFLVNYRRHSHDPFSCYTAINAARLAIVPLEQFGPCRTVFDLYTFGISDKVGDGRGVRR